MVAENEVVSWQLPTCSIKVRSGLKCSIEFASSTAETTTRALNESCAVQDQVEEAQVRQKIMPIDSESSPSLVVALNALKLIIYFFPLSIRFPQVEVVVVARRNCILLVALMPSTRFLSNWRRRRSGTIAGEFFPKPSWPSSKLGSQVPVTTRCPTRNS